jgi:hypothetical protein
MLSVQPRVGLSGFESAVHWAALFMREGREMYIILIAGI